ncbi:hypothetical protein [Pedobacter chitinilyticus]|uniref:Uncharacterized protein n=1 Tax=Pedobacter chitinilyticus TaxID=2233776 RepID=A0A443YJJ9_9SPHI|nr:hypothetical protein [Pedobacter chitinilyticus]RWU03917.1 hypothetical protein DPV69_19725 [Pedobacter chitinilyticus]
MGISLIYAILFLSVVFILGIALLINSLKRKSVISFLISIVLMSPMILISSTNYIDEVSISKKDIISDLKHLDINLTDDFKIKENTVTGMPERIQDTELEISTNDKHRIIEIAKNGFNSIPFKKKKELNVDLSSIKNEISYVRYPDFYAIEIYKDIDHYPTRIILTIYRKGNILKYQRIED